MAKAGLSNNLLGRKVIPQKYNMRRWFGVSELTKNHPDFQKTAFREQYVPLPERFTTMSDKGVLFIKAEQLTPGAKTNEDGTGIVPDTCELVPATIVAAWTEGGATKVTIESHTGEVKEDLLTCLKLVPSADKSGEKPQLLTEKK